MFRAHSRLIKVGVQKKACCGSNFDDDPMDSETVAYGFHLRKKQNLDFSMFGLSKLIRYDIFDGEFRRTHDKED